MRNKTKIWLITAVLLVLIGCVIFGGAMMKLNWDFTKLSTVKYETNEYRINESFSDISIKTDTADVVFVPSENGEPFVVCYEPENAKHSVSVKDKTLAVELIDTRKWYEYIGISFSTPKIAVHIPAGEYGAISVKTSTGGIAASDITTDTLDLSVSTGKIIAKGITCKDDMQISVSTGKAELTDTSCKNLESSGSTGNVSLTNVIATGKLSIVRSTGDVTFDGCDGATVFVKTDTGSVKGTLLSDKVYIVRTDTGRIDVPKSLRGGRCEIITSTGNITVKKHTSW